MLPYRVRPFQFIDTGTLYPEKAEFLFFGVLLKAKVVQQKFVITPIRLHFYPALQIDAAPQKLFTVGTGSAGNFFEHRTAFSDHHALVTFPFAVNVHVDIDQISVRPFFEAFYHDGNPVRDLISHKEQRFFTDDLCHKLLFRHVGIRVIIEVVGAFHCVAAQCIKEHLAAIVAPDTDRIDFVKNSQCFQLFPAGLQIGRLLDQIPGPPLLRSISTRAISDSFSAP